jgi:dihydrofolate synthase / folylpolyglutamate synthase
VNYREALAWLYATQKFGIKLGLENTERLLRALNILEGRVPRARANPASRSSALQAPRIIHVAGTNGKGSVCAMIDSISRAAGFRTGLFTSPHLISFRERVRVDGELIPEDDVARGLSAIRNLVRNWDPHPTFFEITTALALQHFQNARCEIIVLETGMGGRLDATNAIAADVSVITPIDFDHQKWLGNSITEIAAEKAGIIKSGVPVLSALQPEEAAHVINNRAREFESPLEFVRDEWTQSPVTLRGAHQKSNAALAVAAVRHLEASISDDVVSQGLRSVEWPARFQTWNERIIIDGAHNPAGMRTLVQTWRNEFGDDRTAIVLAILQEKNADEMVQELSNIGTRFILPPIRSIRAIPPSELADLIRSITALPSSVVSSVSEALSMSEKFPDRVLITGSLHFAGEALAHLGGEPEALEDCTQ